MSEPRAVNPPGALPPPGQSGLRGFLDLLGFMRPYRVRYGAAIAALAASMGFGLMFPVLVGQLLDASIPSVKVMTVPPWMRNLDTVALVLVGSLVVQAALTFFSSVSFHRAGEGAVVRLRCELYELLLRLPMTFFGEHRVGELSSRLSSDITQIADTLIYLVPAAVRQTMLLVGGIGLIAYTSPRLSGVMLSSLPVIILLAVAFGRRIRRFSRAAQDQLAESATIVDETLQSIASVKAFTNEGHEVSRYSGTLERFLGIIFRNAPYRAGLIAFVIVGVFGSVVMVMWYGARLMQAGVLSHGELTRFMLSTMFVASGVGSFAEIMTQIQKAIGATERVRELMDEKTEAQISGVEGRKPKSEDGGGALSGEIEFRDVSFRYPSRADLPVLRNVSLKAAPGEKIALVGPSGAGKSTIVSLILRFYEPDAGCVLFDGRNARELDLAAVRGDIAMVPQEVLLFGGSIRENIAYGRPGASEEAIREAARRAHCVEFIERFPEGYDTLVGERGVKLSGGQRQRLAIARAFLRDPRILIFDEATSSLDSESEALIQSAFATLLEGRTAVVIAHRLATVRRVDRIYVLEQGSVTESGSHEELIVRPGGTYRRLAEMQFAS